MTTHKVQAGESLSAIAQRYLGKASLYPVIARANNMADADRLAIGTELVIPEPEASATKSEKRASENQASENMLDQDQLLQILNTQDKERAEKYITSLNLCFQRYQINTPLRIAHFLAQVCHESNNFKSVSENLNYSGQALSALFGKYFQSAETSEYARQPEKIANRVYASRMGNNDEVSGDGWKYRGRGLMQLTGKDNYCHFAEACGVDVVSDPDLVASDPELSVAVAAWYWDSRGLNQYADSDDIKAITKRINGGYNGLEDREDKLATTKVVLGIKG